MGLKAFFCFDHRLDIQRARRVKNCWETRGGRASGFPKPEVWKKLAQKGEPAYLRWIENQVASADVCVVLIGSETNADTGVRHAMRLAHRLQKGLLGIYVHQIRGAFGEKQVKGKNPFETLFIVKDLRRVALSDIYPTYDWLEDAGHFHLQQWIEKAGRATHL
jgi:hypothetical protein